MLYLIGSNFINTLIAIVISLVLAVLTHVLIENPIRYGRIAKLKKYLQIIMAITIMALLNWQFQHWHTNTAKFLATNNPLAAYGPVKIDYPIIYSMGCDTPHSTEVKPCTFGSASASKTAVLFGDSFAGQWFPTLEAMLDPKDWRIIVLTKSACPMIDKTLDAPDSVRLDFTDCTIWRDNVIKWLQTQHIDRLFISNIYDYNFTDRQWTEGTWRLLDRLIHNADAIYLIEPSPPLEFNGPDCLMQQKTAREGIEKCQSQIEDRQWKKVSKLLHSVTIQHPEIHWIETSSFVCPAGTCKAIRDGMVVFRDTAHVTANFAKTTADHFRKQLQ